MIWSDRAVATWARANGDANGVQVLYTNITPYYIQRYSSSKIWEFEKFSRVSLLFVFFFFFEKKSNFREEFYSTENYLFVKRR